MKRVNKDQQKNKHFKYNTKGIINKAKAAPITQVVNNYYQLLRIRHDASKQTIKECRRKLMLTFAYDHNTHINDTRVIEMANETHRAIISATKVLLDDEARRIYNNLLARGCLKSHGNYYASNDDQIHKAIETEAARCGKTVRL